MRHGHGKIGRTVPIVRVCTHRVRHVHSRSTNVEWFTVPALRKVDAPSKPVRAARETRRKTRGLLIWSMTEPLSNRLGLRVGRHGAGHGTTGKHAKSGRELVHGFVLADAVEVVDLV